MLRVFSRTKLRIRDDSIEELDGPIIRKDEIALVNEYTHKYPGGIEIVACQTLVRRYRIFVPAAPPQYQEVEQIIQSWVHPQSWHVR